MKKQKIYNAAGKLVCVINDGKTIEIISRGCRTIISFKDNGAIKIISEYVMVNK